MRYENADVEFDVGPLESLLSDPEVQQIMVNGIHGIYIRKNFQLIKTDLSFQTEDDVLHTINSIVEPLGRYVNEQAPIVDARLPDGSRVNAVIRPIALTGPTLTIMKAAQNPLTLDEIVKYGSVTQQGADFLKACVRSKRNMVISGTGGSGKMTVLNALSEYIPIDERIVTVETSAELQLQHSHVVVLETRPPDHDGKGQIDISDLIMNARYMRPNRIITGWVRGAEAWDMLQTMTLGYNGSMFILLGATPQDSIEELELLSTGKTNLPLLQIRLKIASAVDIITQQVFVNKRRYLTHITEVVGMRNNVIETRNIFEYIHTGVDADGTPLGELKLVGKPTFAHLLDLPSDFWVLD